MTIIEKYLELKFKIDISDFRIKLLSSSPDEREDLIKEQETRDALREEYDAVKTQLSEPGVEADTIRTAFIHVANGILKVLPKLKDGVIIIPT